MENSKIKAFIPLLYLVWSDDLLTQKEFATLQEFISSLILLSPEQQQYLLSKVDIANPPSRNELTQWKSDIEKSIKDKSSIKSIFDIATALSDKDLNISGLESSFTKLENDLGILGEEVIQKFKRKADSFTASSQTNSNFDIQKITEILDGKEAAIIKKVKSVISRPEFAYETSTDINVYRETVYNWCKILADENLGNMAYPKRHGGGENIADYFAIMETLSYHDLSLVIKFGVQFGLWGMSVQSLGTEKHYAKYLKDIGSLKLPGCFAMTETHHGSNVKGLETTATYNHSNQTFTIHTPNKNAQKEYIGNAAVHGQMATVFAKLIIDNHDYGVNAFVVPLRDTNGNTLNGIT
ncbi:MAG: acyl-CoA dehydrogenase family protein, partial [Flavobacterium sp.]